MLVFLVTAHEFGHFLMARKNGVEVEEFGICFPPRALCWRKVDGKWKRIPKKQWKKMPGEGLIISLNWLPIGGFCQMKGESDAAKEKGSFGCASYWGKTKILFGGVAANWLIAFVILTVLAITGMPQFLDNQFEIASDSRVVVTSPVVLSAIKPDSPAANAGFQEGDTIKRIGRDMSVVCDKAPCPTTGMMEEDISMPSDFTDYTKQYPGQRVVIYYERNGEEKSASVKLNEEGSEYLFGAVLSGSSVHRSTWSAPIVGAGLTLQLTGETFKGLGTLLVNLVTGIVKQVSPASETRQEGSEALKSATDGLSGPVGIIGILFPAFVSDSATSVFFLVAIISISLACMNVLPIPALDGGRWLLITIFKLRKKELTKEKEEKIVGRAFMAIIILALIVTIIDVMRLMQR